VHNHVHYDEARKDTKNKHFFLVSISDFFGFNK